MVCDKRKVFIITGESSGELYGSFLARELKLLNSDVNVYGVGGERMRSEGVEIMAGITGAFGLIEAVSSLKILKDTFKKITNMLEQERPAVIVLIDFPEFNLKVAKKARSLGIKVLYYVSPQVWAWRKGRVKIIKELSNMIAVLLPFEEALYREAGANCEFVGHPIMEEIENIKGSKSFVRESLGLDPEKSVLGFLPGSRDHELKRLLPLYIKVLRGFEKIYPDYQYILPFAPNIDISKYQQWLSELKLLNVKIIKGKSAETLLASDVALIASGTATFQAALIGLPMVVVYKLSPISYIIGRMVVKVKYISLANLLMGEEVVKELIQREANTENIIKELRRIIMDEKARAYMAESFKKIRSLYEGKKASRRVAEIVGKLAEW